MAHFVHILYDTCSHNYSGLGKKYLWRDIHRVKQDTPDDHPEWSPDFQRFFKMYVF